MALCFCGCGRKVKFGVRAVNKRGATIMSDVALVRRLLDIGVASPNGEMFVHDGLMFCEVLADATHAGVDPGPGIERETAGFMAFARKNFSEASIGRKIRVAGVAIDAAAEAMSAGQFDPFAEIDYPLRAAATDERGPLRDGDLLL